MVGSRRGLRFRRPYQPQRERVDSIRVLGVTLQPGLRMASHIEADLSASSSSTHALRVLGSHGLASSSVPYRKTVAMVISSSHIFYTSPAWLGLTSAEERCKIDQLIVKNETQWVPPSTNP